MLPFKRASNNKIDRWFFTVNKPIILIVIFLLLIGILLNLTATPYVSLRLGISPFYFFYRHLVYVLLAIIILITVSFLNKNQIVSLAFLIFVGSILSIFIVLILHLEVKGAKRWIHIFGISLQPSEFIKVCFPIVLGSLWEKYSNKNKIISYFIISLIYVITVALIIIQPDLGMAILISLVFASIIFLSGVKLIWMLLFSLLGIVLLLVSYLSFSHVHYRVDNFFNNNKPYQVIKAIETIQNGGLFGVGAGRGYFKQYLPDAHTDFIFAVAIEEYGLIFAFILLGLFGYLFFLVFKILKKYVNSFYYISISGLIVILVFQTLIHISSNIYLIPTKGMTLPFISYGGSSLISSSLLIGFLVALSRKQY